LFVANDSLKMYDGLSDAATFNTEMLFMKKKKLYGMLIEMFNLDAEWGRKTLEFWHK
jgi:hypothetical protein